MHAYLVTGLNKSLKEEKVKELVNQLKVVRLGFELKKIADLRELSKFVNLSLSEKSAMVIENIDQASADTQNAFLKNLEEPQENLIYILTANSEESVIPTIASRCQIVETKSEKIIIEKETREKVEKFLDSSVGERLKETSKITKREDAIAFMKDVLVVVNEDLNENPKLGTVLELGFLTLRRLELNGNVQIQLTNFVVNS